MDNKEKRLPEEMGAAENRQIQLVVNHSDADETTIDLGNVFRNMKNRRRLFAWVLVLCLTVGVCAPLLIGQFKRTPVTVSSLVTLRYEAPTEESLEAMEEGRMTLAEAEFGPVSDLTAPDGTELDLGQITSAYVLQGALNGLTLSQPVTAGNLRANIGIRTVLTEASNRTKEALAGLAEAKNAGAYEQLQKAEMKYENRLIVTLTNGFADENGNVSEWQKKYLRDEELSVVLDRVLTVYNDYLVRNYADMRLPEDAFSAIDIEDLDVLESLDKMRDGLTALNEYAQSKSEAVREYRSWRTGRSLTDWTETLQTFRNINVDYLYTMVSENGITRDKAALLTSYRYQLRMAQNELDKVNQDIAETKQILNNYKNDEIYVSMQESASSQTTQAATEYYNSLVTQQTQNYDRAAELKTRVATLEERIQKLDATKETAVTEEVEAELARSLETAKSLYSEIRTHMEDLFASPLYTTYADHSAPQGKAEGLLAANAKKMVIGAVVGFVIGCGIWFLGGLIPEFSRKPEDEEKRKGAARA